MAYPFQLIAGSGLDELARQNQYWAGLNQSVDTGNVERQIRAQELQNQWASRAADEAQLIQRANIDRQLQAESEARALALGREQEMQRRKEAAAASQIQQEQFKAQLKYGADQLAAQQRMADERIAAAAKNKDLITEAHGQHLAANYLVAKNNADAANAAFDELKGNISDAQGQLEKLGSSKEDNAKRVLLTGKIRDWEKQANVADRAARTHQNALDRLLNSAENGGFEINEDGTVVHADTGKKWTWKNTLRAARTATGDTGMDLSSVLSRPTEEASVLPAEMAGGTPSPWGGSIPTLAPAPTATVTTPPPAMTPAPAPVLRPSAPSVPLSTRIGNWFGVRNTVLPPSNAAAPVVLPDVAGSEMTRFQRRMALNDPGYTRYPAIGQMGTPGGSMGSDIGPRWWGEQYPPAPQDYRQREVGRVYSTPRGPMRGIVRVDDLIAVGHLHTLRRSSNRFAVVVRLP